jgi:hypothetical protein
VPAAAAPPMNANAESFSKNDFMDDRKKVDEPITFVPAKFKRIDADGR